MRTFLIVTLWFAFSVPGIAQVSDNAMASREDIILYLRTMHSHDMLQRSMEVQSQAVQQLLRDQFLQEKGKLPPDFDAHMKKMMDDLIKGTPADEIIQAMIPTYQKHFTKGDIQAMNAFYSSPVGQKVLQELPAVMQDGMQAAMPIMSKYLGEWKTRMEREMRDMEESSPPKS